MKNKLGFKLIVIFLVVELTSLIMNPKEFLDLLTQGICLVVIFLLIIFILIENYLKTERNKVILGNIYLSLFFLVGLGGAIYSIIILFPLFNNKYTDPTFYIILMVIIVLIAIYGLTNIWVNFHKKYKKNNKSL